MAVTCLGVGPVMANPTLDPYVSEFEFASRFHPSNNPDCMNRWSGDSDEGNDDLKGDDFEYRRSRRSPEEGSPVGQEPSIEVRAILVRCPKNEEETDDILINRNIYNITAARSQDILDFQGFDRDEPEHHPEVRHCRRKLIITMKFNNIGKTKTQEEFVVIDHVLDPVTMQKSRLLNPFVVKVRQEPVLQLYALKFKGVVNAQAREEVINKNISNYKGCDDGSENPTCGQMMFEDKPVPYSQGFCCSCSSELNIQRQASLMNESGIPPFPSFFSRSKLNSIGPSKSSQSANKDLSDDHSDLEETFQGEELFEDSKNPNQDQNGDPSKDQKVAFAKSSDDDEAALINLKNLSRVTKEKQKTLSSSFHDPHRVDLAAELTRLEEEYKNLRRSSLIRAEDKHNGNDATGTQKLHPSAVKDAEKPENDNGPDNFVGIEKIQDKVATKIGNDRYEHIPVSSYEVRRPFPGTGQFNDRGPTMGIDVPVAIKPKEKSTTCPVDPGMELPTTCPMTRLKSQTLGKTEFPAVVTQMVIDDGMDSSSTERPSYNVDERQEVVDSHSMETTTDLVRESGTKSGEPLTNVAITGNANVPRTNHERIVKSRLGKMNNATSTGNSTTTFPDTEMESRVTSEGTTEDFQHTFDPNQSFDNLSTQVESPANLSSSFSSGNHSKDDAILLSGSLQNQLANWFSRDKGKKFWRRRRGKKSRKNSEIGYGNEVESFAMTIPNLSAHNLINGRLYDVPMTTTRGFRNPVQIYLKTDHSFDRHNKKKTFFKLSDPEDVNVPITKESEPPNVPRSHRSIDDDSVWNQDTDQQKSIDKEIEDDFVDISEVLKSAARDPTSEKEDNSVIEKFDLIVDNFSGRKSMMENDLPVPDNPIEGPEATKQEIEIEMINSTGEFVDPDNFEPTSIPKEIGSSKIPRHNVAKDSNEADDTETHRFSSSFNDRPMEESESTGSLENHGNAIRSQVVKHTEVSDEPVSELPLTTGPQIIVDRFKIARPFVDSPKNYEQLLKETLENHSTIATPKIRALEENEQTLDTNLLSTSPHTKNRNTKSVSGNISTLYPEIQEEISTGTSPQTTAIFGSASSVQNDTSLHGELSPVVMIENLKKQLRKEAERYAVPSSALQGATVNGRGVQGHPNSVQEVREVNTEVTPAEKIEDLITDEETLPPDEETGLTTKSLPKTTTMTITISSMKNDLENTTYTLIPRRFLQDAEVAPRNKKHAVALKRIEKILKHLRDPSQSSSSSSLRLRSKRAHKKLNRLRHHHLHRISRRERRSSTEYPNRVEPSSKSRKVSLFRKPKSDEHARLTGFTVKEIAKSDAAVDPIVDDVSTSMMTQSQVPKMRDVHEKPMFHRTERPTVDEKFKGEKSLKVKGKALIRRMRKSEGAKKKVQAQSTPKFRSIYPRSDEINLISETVVDEVTGRGDIGGQNKRDDLKTFDETAPEALIFYDYDAIDSPPAVENQDQEYDNKRSLDSLEDKINDESRSSAKSALHPLKKRSNSVSHDEVVTAEGSTLLNKKIPRSMNMSDDQFRIEPSGGWKAKMELLKLKKHADVLKEYLNWRHDIVRPEPIGISGYTTKISMTTEEDEGHSETITTQQFNVTKETTLMSATVTSTPVPEDISITIQPHEDLITTMTSNNDDHVTRETSMSQQFNVPNKTTLTITTVASSSVPGDISVSLQPREDFITTITSDNDYNVTRENFKSSFSESSSISSTTRFSENRSLTGSNTADEVETSTGNLETECQENSPEDGEPSTGRILPPCCSTTKNTVTTCPAGLEQSVDRFSGRPSSSEVPNTLSKVVPDHPGQSGNIENDLLVISIMEKNRLNNKNLVRSHRRHKPSSNIYRIRKEGDPVHDPHHRRRKSKRKTEHSTSSISKRNGPIRRARRLMSIEDLDYKNDDEEGDLMFEDYEDNVNEESPASGILDAFYHDHDSGKLGDKWEQLIDKIIHTNSSEFWEPENTTEAPLPERPDDNKSALKQLHFKNADKYIREMARKIVHNSNIHITNPDLGKHGEKNRTGRRLLTYPRLTRRKTISRMRKQNAKVCGNYANAVDDKRFANDDDEELPHSAKKSVYVRKSRAVAEEPADRPTQYRDHRSFGFEDSENPEDIPEDSDSEDRPESSLADDHDYEPEEADDSQLQALEQKNLNYRYSSSDTEGDRNHDPHNDYSPDIKVFKVIPLDAPSSVLGANNRPDEREKDAKTSRMTGSQLLKVENDHVPEETVKPDKIKPAEFPQGNEAEDNENLAQDADVSQQNSRSAKAPSKMVESAGKDQEHDDNNDPKNPTSDLDANYEIVPLTHVNIEHQPFDKERLEHDYVSPENPDNSCPYPDINDGSDKTEDNGNRDQVEVVTMNMDNDEELREPSGIGTCPEPNRQDGSNISSSPKDDEVNRIRPTEEPSGNHQEITISSGTTCEGESKRLLERKRIRLKNVLAIMEFIKKIKDIIGEEGTHMANTAEDRNKEILFISSDVKTEPVKQTDSDDPKHRDFHSMDSKYVMAHSNKAEEGQKSHKGPKDVQVHETELPTTLQVPETNKSTTKNFTHNSNVTPNNLTNDHQVPEDENSQHGNEKTERDILKNLQQKINDRLEGLHKSLPRNDSQDVKTSSKKERSVALDFSPEPKVKRHRLRSQLMQLRGPGRKMYRERSLSNSGEVSKTGNEKSGRRAAGKGTSKRNRKKKKKKKNGRKKKKKKKKKKKHKKNKGKNLRDTEVQGKSWWPFGRQLMSLSNQRESTSDQNLDQDVVSLERRKRRVHRAKYPHGKKKKMKKRRKHKRVKKKKKSKKGKEKKKMGLRNKRQIKPSGNQVRGGQDCMDRRHPPDVDPAKYLESAHCLRFSDLWYSVYGLENPIMEHTVYLQLFEKHNRADGTAHWEDLTQGSMVRMGTFTRHQRDSVPTIVFTYSGPKSEPQNRALNLDPSKDRLLVPSPVPRKKASDYPEIRGGSGEYLVIPTTEISRDGNECDKAGVGFAAFSKQQNRCDRPKGSCLKNQPLDYWARDMEARKSGRPGCYFLSNFASVPSEPIKYNVSGSGSREYLGLEYHSTHVSAIDIQVRSDYNAIVRVGSSGRVTEVYVDSTALEHTVVTVVISNMGLASSPYQPRITDCPSGLPVSWTKAKGIMQVIPPQHDQRVTLDLYGQLLLNEFHCSVEVVNHRGELVAMRRIRVQKMDRCFCVWHCLCACIGGVSGMGCTPMSPEHYHAAGFQGPVPVVTTETSILMNAVKNILTLSALLVLLLLLLGILKWFIGLFASTVGRWGLDNLLEGRKVEEYLEPELKCRCVMTDEDGWPVHPDTGQRTVRICSRKFEFLLNLIFFLTYPVAVCCNYCRRSLNSARQRNCCPDESKTCLISEKGGCPKMICVSTYGENSNTKLEAEDTRYVMNELKKSQESLQNPKRSKTKIGHKNSKISTHKNKSAADVSAKKLVHDLLSSRVVFRNLTEPIGGLKIPYGTTYSLRGYFLNAEDGGYRFITPCPFKQHWLIENKQKVASGKPPETYPSNLFMRSFGTARHVYESDELSLNPKGICINVQHQEET